MMKLLQITFILVSIFSSSLVLADRLGAEPTHDDAPPAVEPVPVVDPVTRPTAPTIKKEDATVRMMRHLNDCISRPGSSPGSPIPPGALRGPSSSPDDAVRRDFGDESR